MANTSHLFRPTTIGDLVGRLKDSRTSPKEAAALREWSKAMIRIFKDQPSPSYVPEAAALAGVVTAREYSDLFSAFVDGTASRDYYSEYLTGLETVTRVFSGKPSDSYGLQEPDRPAVVSDNDAEYFRALINLIIAENNTVDDGEAQKRFQVFRIIVEDERFKSTMPKKMSKAKFEETWAAFTGTADCSNLNSNMLMGLVFALNRAEGTKWTSMPFGPLVEHLRTRLDNAVKQNEVETQYQLVCTLSAALDVMTDKKAAGLSRESLHEPLLQQLESLSNAEELRLAQVASYAHQALLGIPNDESPYRALFRHLFTVAQGVAKVASAASSLDPSKMLDSLSSFQELPELVSSMVDVFDALSELSTATGEAMPKHQKSWYAALRCADFLVQANAYHHLRAFVNQVPCLEEEEFICGLFARLETAWVDGDETSRGRAMKFLEEVLVPIGRESRRQRARGWLKQVATTVGRADWQDVAQPRHSVLKFLNKKYKSTIIKKAAWKDLSGHELLEVAWLGSDEAHVFYADEEIRQHYLQNDSFLLRVDRLSGGRLPMEQCYINFAIVDKPGQGIDPANESTSTGQSSRFTLLSRLSIQEPDTSKHVKCENLFNQRLLQGDTRHPRRILIRGRAGVGKTTLCKKLVFELTRQPMDEKFSKWGELFDRVLWLPLRNLKRRQGANYNLEKLFLDEYFSQQQEGAVLAKALHRKLSLDQHNRTLFILDGLDEVTSELEPESDMFEFLHYLLGQPNVIITARPHARLPPGLSLPDLELETIGFYPEQVDAYIESTFTGPEKDEVQTFLRQHPLIQSLVRIPIQLDALCYTWSEGVSSRTIPRTMTGLYKAIEIKLWQKDILQLGKYRHGKPVTAADVRLARNAFQVYDFVTEELKALELFAFVGMFNGITDFEQAQRDRISQSLRTHGIDTTLDAILPKLSFLRTSNASATESALQNYHFLHLTFQEYFAAQYFVKKWLDGQPLECLDLATRKTKRIETRDFLRDEKYNERYDIFWRFVTGLLQGDDEDEDREDQLYLFFSAIQNEGRDILGPVHIRLVLHCLSEVDEPEAVHGARKTRIAQQDQPSKFSTLRGTLEDQFKQWLLFESREDSYIRLSGEMEYPSRLLEAALRDGSEEQRERLLRSLLTRGKSLQKVSEAITELVAPWLESAASPRLKATIVNAILCPQVSMSSDYLDALVALLTEVIQHASSDTVPTLREKIMEVVLQGLQSDDGLIKFGSVAVLSEQPVWSDALLEAVIVQYASPEFATRYGAALVLQSRPNLPESTLERLVAGIGKEDVLIREIVLSILRGYPVLPKKILDILIARFEFMTADEKAKAIEFLQKQPAVSREMLKSLGQVTAPLAPRVLPEETIDKQLECLNSPDPGVRYKAVSALMYKTLPQRAIDALTAKLEDPDNDVRAGAIDCLRDQPTLPASVLAAITARLEDPYQFARYSAVKTLLKHPQLPGETIGKMVPLLEDPDRDIRRATIEALGAQTQLSSETARALAGGLNETTHYKLGYYIISALGGGHSHLPGDVIEAVCLWLQTTDENHKALALDVLAAQTQLSAKHLEAAVARLDDEDISTALHAEEVVRNQSTLPKETFLSIAKLLENMAPKRKSAILKTLGGKTKIPEEALSIMVHYLDDKEVEVKVATAEALAGQQSLPRSILEILAGRLKRAERNEVGIAVDILKKHTDLPRDIFEALLSQLEAPEWNIRLPVTAALMRQVNISDEDFSSMLTRMSELSFDNLYDCLLRRSFWVQTTWRVEGEVSYLEEDGIQRVIPFEPLRSAVERAQASLHL